MQPLPSGGIFVPVAILRFSDLMRCIQKHPTCPAKELIVFAAGGPGQEGALYVLGIADDTLLWYSCRPLACGNPPPAVGAVTSPESPDLLLLGDFVWDWTAEKTDAA